MKKPKRRKFKYQIVWHIDLVRLVIELINWLFN